MNYYCRLGFDKFDSVNYFKNMIERTRHRLVSKYGTNFSHLEETLVISTVNMGKNVLNQQITNPGDIVFVPIFKPHTFEMENTGHETIHIFFTKNEIDQVLNFLFQNHSDSLENKEMHDAKQIELNCEIIHNKPEIYAMVNRFQTGAVSLIENKETLTFDINKLNILIQLAIELFGHRKTQSILTEKKAIRDEVVQRVYATVEYMRDHYYNDLKLADLSKIANLSTCYYSNVFTQVMKQSPQSFLIHIRMIKAKELIEQTHMTIDAIALKVGITSLSTFYRSFKSLFGISPAAYRLQK